MKIDRRRYKEVLTLEQSSSSWSDTTTLKVRAWTEKGRDVESVFRLSEEDVERLYTLLRDALKTHQERHGRRWNAIKALLPAVAQ